MPVIADQAIVRRAAEVARRELRTMTTELDAYGEHLTGSQLVAMRKVMRAMRALVKALEQ